MTKTTNPDEINIDEDYSTDEEEEVEGKTAWTSKPCESIIDIYILKLSSVQK